MYREFYKTLASWLRELRIVSLRQLSRYKLYRSIDLHLLQAGYIPAHKALCVLYCTPGPKFSMWTNIFGKTGPGGPKFSLKILVLGPFCRDQNYSDSPSVRLSGTTYSGTTRNKAAKKRYQRVQCHTGLIFKIAIFVKVLRSKVMA